MLHIHRAERADGLVEALAELLADPLPDPFEPDVISVPTRGMERWLTQRLSSSLGATPGRADGICANVAFPFPYKLVGDAVATASGVDPETDPWSPQRAVWPLLEVVGECLEEPWLHSLATHLGSEDDADRRARRFATVRHLAELFDRYALHRPAMVRGWARGEVDVPEEAAWQAELWRRLRQRLADPSPAERLEPACERLRATPSLTDLPERISLFGLTRLPTGHLDVLRALAAGRDVHVFLLHPSPALWDKIGTQPPVVRRADDTTAALADNRLLASWGQDAREMQLVLGTHEHVAHHHPIAARDDTLLARIQADIRADRRPEPRPLAPNDRSIQIHSCHGRARQVEVLRDAILHLLEEDDTLQPRDVIVMCPDIETFAPLIQATFGAGEVVDDEEFQPLPEALRPTDLRVRLADRSLRQTNPVLGVVAQLIDLAGRRLTASDVLDLADREPVRRRFRLEDEDLARIRDWVADSGIRWGLDADHRAPYKLADLPAGTWRAGLDRVLVGVTMTEEGHRLFEGVLPVDDVESLAIDLAGPHGRACRPAAGRGRHLRHRQADHRVGAGARHRCRRPHRHLAKRRLAARAAGADPRRRRQRGRRRAGRAHPARGPRPPRRAAAGPPHARELPHRPPDHLHARADALGTPPGRLPARPRRRGVPPQGPARRRRHHARRPARRRPRPAPRGPPDAARRADGRARSPDRHLRRQRRPHQHAAPARRAGRRAPRRDRADRAGRGGGRPPPAPALRPPQLHARRAGRRRALELQPRHPRRRARDGAGAHRAAAVPGEPAATATRAGARARQRRRLRPPPRACVPAPAAGLRRRDLRRRGRRRAADRARQPRVLAGRPADARRPARGRHERRGGRGRAGARRAPARRARRPGHRQAAPRRRADRRPRRGAAPGRCRCRARSTCGSRSPTAAG